MQDCGLRRPDFCHAAESAKKSAALHFFFARRLLWRFVARSARRADDLKKWGKSAFWPVPREKRARRIRFGASFLAARGDEAGVSGLNFVKISGDEPFFPAGAQ